MSQKNNFDLSDFLVISPQAWKSKILEELKADSEQVLQWETEGLLINAFYTRKDLEKLSYLEDFHSYFNLKSPRHWYTTETVTVKDVVQANLKAQNLLEKGADAIAFNIAGTSISERDLPILLKNISLRFSPIHFYTNSSPLLLIKAILNLPHYYEIKGSLTYELLTEWMEKKDFSETTIKELASAINLLKEVPRYKVLTIDSSYFHQKETGIIREVAYSIALALDYIDRLTENGVSMYDVLSNFGFSFSIGKNYFLEIAKLRAFRFLWNQVTEACNPEFDSFTIPLHCITSEHNFSKEDPYQNIFQNTTEAMAAIIGGCDSLSITPFDKNSKQENEFSSRISRNISLILKEEAYFDKTVDPGAGSFYIENLTDGIAERAWNIITDIEKQGGFINAWEKGLIN